MTKMLIDGEWDSGSGENGVTVQNPANAEAVDVVPRAGAEDVRRAVDAAHEAFAKWSVTPAIERSRILLKVADTLRTSAGEIATTLTSEQGKPINEARQEILGTANIFEYYAGVTGRLRSSSTYLPLSTGDGHFVVTKRSIGVVGAILPWNFPVYLMAWKLAPGLAAGNTFVVKPASTTPLATLKVGQTLLDSGLPRGVVNMVTGPGSVVGAELLGNRKVRKISFTGETDTGKEIMAGAADDLKRITLELGGSDPMIVFDDADLQMAVEGATYGRFRNAGQNCVAVKRLYLQSSIADGFVSALMARVGSIRLGPGLDPQTHMGPLHTARQREEVDSMVRDATDRGAKIAVGGRRPPGVEYSKGYFYEPTLLTNVRPDSRISVEECFGPALPIYTFEDTGQAISMANDSMYGLGSSVWTRDLDKAYFVAERIEAGTTWVNSPHLTRAEVPFGGFKQSGIGRELGLEGLDYYEETKSVQVYDYKNGKKWAFPA